MRTTSGADHDPPSYPNIKTEGNDWMTAVTCNQHRGLSQMADDAARAHVLSTSTLGCDASGVSTSGARTRTSDTIVDEPLAWRAYALPIDSDQALSDVFASVHALQRGSA